MSNSGLPASARSSTPLWGHLFAIIAGIAVSYALVQGVPTFLLGAEGVVIEPAAPLIILAISGLAPFFGAPAAIVILGWGAFFAIGLACIAAARALGLSEGRAFSLALIAAGLGFIINTYVPGPETGWLLAALAWMCVALPDRRLTPQLGAFLALLPFLDPILCIVSLGAGIWLMAPRLDLAAKAIPAQQTP